MFQFGGRGVLFGGLNPQKPPRGDGTGEYYFQKSLHAYC